jgi:hypothetical protein
MNEPLAQPVGKSGHRSNQLATFQSDEKSTNEKPFHFFGLWPTARNYTRNGQSPGRINYP